MIHDAISISRIILRNEASLCSSDIAITYKFPILRRQQSGMVELSIVHRQGLVLIELSVAVMGPMSRVLRNLAQSHPEIRDGGPGTNRSASGQRP
jgi:hypothetical protein